MPNKFSCHFRVIYKRIYYLFNSYDIVVFPIPKEPFIHIIIIFSPKNINNFVQNNLLFCTINILPILRGKFNHYYIRREEQKICYTILHLNSNILQF